MSTYLLEAKQGYDPASAAREQTAFNALDHSLNDPGGFVNKECFSFCFDRVNNQIGYTIQLEAWNNTVTPNNTGRTLTDGFTVNVLAGATYDSQNYGNLNVAVKDISTGAVTLYPTYGSGQNVPAGVHGSDGTWGYLSDAVDRTYSGPHLIDPRTSNMVFHAFGDDNPCSIYILEKSLSYQQRIFPWTEFATATDNHMEPAGITDAYVYAWNQPYILLTDRTLELNELANGYVHTYANFSAPFSAFATTQFRWVFTSDNHMYVVYTNIGGGGVRDYKLTRFDEPSSAPYGGPVVGGGFTDVTPWTSTTGPNTAITDWQTTFQTPSYLKLYDLRNGDLAFINELTPLMHAAASTDPAFYRVDCTYYNIAGSTFDYHQGFVTGYMKGTTAGTFTNAAGVADADWVVEQLLEVDQDLNMHSYAFSGVDYTKRTFFAVVQPVVGGSWTYNVANRMILILTYQLTSGSAPSCTQFISGQNWDDVYSGSTGFPHPSYKVIDRWDNQTGFWLESGFFSTPDNAWWFMGADDFMATLDPTYVYEQWNGFSLPFVRFSVGSPTPPGSRRSMVWSMIGHPEL